MAWLLEFRLLGPVEAVVDGRPVALPAAKPRALLAVLLLDRNRVVSVGRLVEDLSPTDFELPDPQPLPIPGQPFGFRRLLRAQAAGDFASLKERGPTYGLRIGLDTPVLMVRSVSSATTGRTRRPPDRPNRR